MLRNTRTVSRLRQHSKRSCVIAPDNTPSMSSVPVYNVGVLHPCYSFLPAMTRNVIETQRGDASEVSGICRNLAIIVLRCGMSMP